MRTIRHILTCVDLSPGVPDLVAVSSRLAARLGASMTLFHAEPSPPDGADDSAGWSQFAEHYKAARDEAAAELGATVRRAGVSFDFLSLVDSPRRAILEAAGLKQTDLIVLGSGVEAEERGVGSTVSRVLRLAEVPVLVLPTRTGRADSWRFSRVLAPVDFQETSVAGLAKVKQLTDALDSAVDLATVVQWPRRTGLLAQQDDAASMPEVIANIVEGARAALGAHAVVAGLPEAGVHVIGGDRPADAIAQLASEIGADLIVLPSLGKGSIARVLLGSTTERLVGVSSAPVLVIPRKALTSG